MKFLLVLLCFILFFQNSSFSENDKNSLKGKSQKYTGITGKAGDVNFGDSFEKCKNLFKTEGYSIDSIQINENKDTIVFVNKAIVYDVGLKNCRFEFDINGLHTLVYSIRINDLVDSNEILVIYDNLFTNLKKYYKAYVIGNQITHSYGVDGCFSNITEEFEFGNTTREVTLIKEPKNENVLNFKFLKLYQHYNFPKTN